MLLPPAGRKERSRLERTDRGPRSYCLQPERTFSSTRAAEESNDRPVNWHDSDPEGMLASPRDHPGSDKKAAGVVSSSTAPCPHEANDVVVTGCCCNRLLRGLRQK